jgi:hypothetical protein
LFPQIKINPAETARIVEIFHGFSARRNSINKQPVRKGMFPDRLLFYSPFFH